MGRNFRFLVFMFFFTVLAFGDAEIVLSGGPVELNPSSIVKTVKPESKFFDIITLTNRTDKKIKLWIESALFYIDDNGNKYEVELKKKSSWSFSPVIGVGISIGSGGRTRTGTGVGVEISPDGRKSKYVIETASGLNFKPNEEKTLTVNFDISDLRVKNNKNMRITEGKLTGKLVLEDRSKTY
ncbi:MAG: hypothetical protein LBV03_02870, partial [Fusobacteriales bacterium]|nr:hypothetical protein [Fusobacteriales bacterium]